MAEGAGELSSRLQHDGVVAGGSWQQPVLRAASSAPTPPPRPTPVPRRPILAPPHPPTSWAWRPSKKPTHPSPPASAPPGGDRRGRSEHPRKCLGSSPPRRKSLRGCCARQGQGLGLPPGPGRRRRRRARPARRPLRCPPPVGRCPPRLTQDVGHTRGRYCKTEAGRFPPLIVVPLHSCLQLHRKLHFLWRPHQATHSCHPPHLHRRRRRHRAGAPHLARAAGGAAPESSTSPG